MFQIVPRQIITFFLLIPLFTSIISINFSQNNSNINKFKKHFNLLTYFFLLCISIFLVIRVYKSGPLIYEVASFGKYGLILIADLLSSFFICLSSFLSFIILLYSTDYINTESKGNIFYAIYNIMIFGINGIFLTGDLFNLYIFFEIMFLSSSVCVLFSEKVSLITVGYKIEAIYKYFIMGFLSSVFLLIGIISIYSSIGSLNLSDIAYKIYILYYYGNFPNIILISCSLFLISFGNKAALFPFHFWLPDVHPTVPTPISALFSGLLTKVGIYCIIRILFIVFFPFKFYFLPILLILSLCTIFIGSVGASGQYDIKKILAYSSIAQIGFILCGLSLNTFLSIFSSIVYLLSHSISKSLLFLVSGGIIHITNTRNIFNMQGMKNLLSFYSIFLFYGFMSLSGFPPSLGFISKFMIFESFIENKNYLILFYLIITTIITIYYSFHTWTTLFWGVSYQTNCMKIKIPVSFKISILCLSFLIFYFGLFPNLLFQIIENIAFEIFNPEFYISVLFKRYI